MSSAQVFDPRLLNAAGLNLQAVFKLADLPPDVRRALEAFGHYRQLILIGHGGRAMWEAVQAAGIDSTDPIDAFSIRTAENWLAEQLPGCRHAVVYPGSPAVGLQALGKLAGWHHPSPFMVGINATWGSWFAYRVVLLADSDFPPTLPERGVSPCVGCASQSCLLGCPAGALAGSAFSLDKCVAWRKRADSSCRTSCLARIACPVASEHRYSGDQIRHTYAISMRMIDELY